MIPTMAIITLTQQPMNDTSLPRRNGDHADPDVGAPDLLMVSAPTLRKAVIAELREFFANPRVSGIALAEWEAKYIASGIVLRLSHSAAIEDRS
jgi:hypothetical protein